MFLLSPPVSEATFKWLTFERKSPDIENLVYIPPPSGSSTREEHWGSEVEMIFLILKDSFVFFPDRKEAVCGRWVVPPQPALFCLGEEGRSIIL